MKRAGRIQRRTFLRSKTALTAFTPMSRSARLARRAIARKRPQRTREEVAARRLLAQRSGHVCEVCGNARADNAHHRVNASQGGAWCPTNLIHCCGSGTTGCHGRITEHPAWAREHGYSVSAYGDPATAPVLIAVRGYVLLDDQGGTHPITTTDRESA